MTAILPVPSNPPSVLQEQARALFRLYAAFLRDHLACGTFNFPRFDEEIAALPAPYTGLAGEVLLALLDEIPAACIAFRSVPLHPGTCEIKRLFVHPGSRGHGLARLLITEALTRIAALPACTRIILDTDTVHMPAALALYLSFGFREYAPREGNIAFLEQVSGASRYAVD